MTHPEAEVAARNAVLQHESLGLKRVGAGQGATLWVDGTRATRVGAVFANGVAMAADNRFTIGTKPPMDISYPPGNARAPIYNANDLPRGTVLTAQQAAERLNAPKLIVLLGPAGR